MYVFRILNHSSGSVYCTGDPPLVRIVLQVTGSVVLPAGRVGAVVKSGVFMSVSVVAGIYI